MDHTHHFHSHGVAASPENINEFFHRLFEVYVPRQQCMYQQADVIWLNVIADALIVLAYFSIPIALYYFVRRRKDLSYKWMFLMFAAFIMSCGTTHLFNVIAIWHPLYRLDGLIKLLTGLISVSTAALLWPLIPHVLALPSPQQLSKANRQLTQEIGERRRVQEELRRAYEELERRVEQRTAQLAQSEERLRLAQQVARVGTFEWNIQKNENRWTPEMEALYGLEPGSFGGTYERWLARVHPEDLPEAERRIRQALEQGEFEAEWRTIWPNGTVRWLAGRGLVFKDAEGQPLRMVGANIDITERKKLEEAQHEANRRKDEFLAMLAHELRNPLAPIRYAVQMLNLKGSEQASMQKQRDVIDRQVNHMGRLLDDLLDISRITQGKVRLRLENLDLRQIAEQGVESMRPQIEGRGQQLVYQIPGSPLPVNGDPTRLEQVLRNLLVNATKYTEPGGCIWMTVGQEAEGEQERRAVVRVRDSGIGIAPEMLGRVFEPFMQAEQSLARTQGGLGIGLSMVKNLVELHGGRVEAHSDGLGLGSEFVVRLPLSPEAEIGPREANEVSAAHAEGDAEENPRRVLVVDDNEDAAASLSELLGVWGHPVQVAHDGHQALAAAREWHPEIILLDIGLPCMDGYEVARRLRQEPATAGVLIVALTGYGSEEDRRRAQEVGFDHHLTKPVQLERLRTMLRETHAG